ncbi:MAG: hypothetical protein ACREX3_08090 [Gammaproteobacteria bacterium]
MPTSKGTKSSAKKPAVLAGGNPQMAKADGDAPTFFRGTSLRPVPPGGTAKEARWIDIHEEDLDEAQLATWVKQAAAIPGWGK